MNPSFAFKLRVLLDFNFHDLLNVDYGKCTGRHAGPSTWNERFAELSLNPHTHTLRLPLDAVTTCLLTYLLI